MTGTEPDNLGPGYGTLDDPDFVPRYAARCHCGAVGYEVRGDPLDAKLCHCRDCQRLHGAPMQWAAIFRKEDVRLIAGLITCRRCGTPIADEGRNMWLAFPTLFDFGNPPRIPQSFKPSCHIFYDARVIDLNDELPRWSGHKDRSVRR
jgi:hypothetical protein